MSSAGVSRKARTVGAGDSADLPPTACGRWAYRVLAALIVTLLHAVPVRAQLTPGQVGQLRSGLGARIEAMTILGGDFGLANGQLRSTGRIGRATGVDTDISVT